MSLRVNLTDLFIDPISQEEMKNPVMNMCGHTFESAELEGWRATCLNENRAPNCPLCREPIANLVPNLLLKQALDVLNSPDNSLANRVEDLTDEERTLVEKTVTTVMKRRKADKSKGIPDRLPEPRSFIKKAGDAISGAYRC